MEREQLAATVTAAQNGDSNALNLLFNTYYNDVYYFALKILKDEDLACDITQEAFVEIINTLGELKVPEAFVTWMRQVTYHQCTRYFKKKKEVLVEEDEEGHSVFDTLEEAREEFIPGEGVDKEDFRATILALLDTLSEEQRAAVLMYYYHEMSVKDIAETQKVSEGTVKSRLNYARRALKKSVEDYEKKNDVKLHCAGVLPLLLWLFAGAGKEVMPLAAANTVAGGVAAATGTSLAVSAAGGSAVAATTATAVAGTGLIAKIVALPVVTKVVAGIVAAALVVGGIGAGVMVSHDQGDSATAGTTQPSPSEMCVHAWVDANCITPKTCKLCGITEGVALGHAWQFSGCEESQSCSGCDEVLPAEGHKWVDANYQSAKHCSGCELTEGDPLQADFEKYGLNVITPQLGVEYNCLTSCYDDTTKKTMGKLYFSDYRVFAGEGNFEAVDGYVWHHVKIKIYFDDNNAKSYGAYSPSVYQDSYYDIDGWDASGYINDDNSLCATVSCNGVDYDQCQVYFERNWEYMTAGDHLCSYDYYWRIPVGYDGFVLSFIDRETVGDGEQHIYDIADENTLSFRFGATEPERTDAAPSDTQLKGCITVGEWGISTQTDGLGKDIGEECTVRLVYTYAIKEMKGAAYDITGAEVLGATLNGLPCQIYQTQDPEKIHAWAEGYSDEEIEFHTVFLVESPEITAVWNGPGENVLADYYFTVRVYLADGTHRDLTFGGEDYHVWTGCGGWLITTPEDYSDAQPSEPEVPFGEATDEQILACLEFSPAGRTPMNDNPGYTYMNETHVVGTRIDAALDIADVEVLYATVNGAPCEVYQTRNRGKISEIMDYEEWNAETFDCRELHNVFLVQSDSPIEVTDDRTDYVIVDHAIMFRIYPTNGEYRDVLYEDDNYILSIFGGGLMSVPEWYE